MTTIHNQIVEAAIEAADLISKRAVTDVEDRLLGQLGGVDERTRELAGTVASLRDLIKALSDGYGSLSEAMQKDLYRVVDELRKSAQKDALDSVQKGSALAAKVFEGEVRGQMEELQGRLIEYVDEKHEHAIRAARDETIASFEKAKDRMEADLKERQRERERLGEEKIKEGLERFAQDSKAGLERFAQDSAKVVAKAVAEAKAAEEKLTENTEQKLKSGLDEIIEEQIDALTVVRDNTKEALLGVEERQIGLEQAAEETWEQVQQDAAKLRTEVFLGTEETLKNLQRQIEETLDGIEAPPGPQGPAGEKGPPGTDGVLTRVETWDPEHGAYARRMCVSHLGGVWQARADTEDEPGGSVDWISITRGISGVWLEDSVLFLRMSDREKVELGRVQGPRGREWEHKGTYDPEHKSDYKWGHVVVLRGSAYVARHDAPGDCPGAGWRMLLQAKAGPAGKRGPAGPRGKAGEPGPPGQIGPPGRGWRYRGRYGSTETYARDDVVNHGQALWIALREVPSHYPPKADQEYWDLVLRNTAGGGGGPGTDELVTITENDTSPGRLQDKVQSLDASVVFSVVNPGGNERLDFAATGAGGGQANTGQNVGVGLGIYKGMSGTILDFFSIADTARVTAAYSVGGNEIELTVPDGVFDPAGSAQQAYDDGSADLTAHKGSGDHDGRYYTEAEVDALLAGRVPTSRILTAGPGLSGGGNLTQDRQFFIADTGVQPGAYTHTNISVNSRGQITSIANGVDTDQRVRVSGTDIQNGYLNEKNESSDGSIVFSITNPGAAEVWNMRLGTTGVLPGTYTLATVTVDDQGRVTTIAQGNVNHAGLPDLASSGHPGGVIQVGGLVGGVVVVAADGSLENSGQLPGGGGSGLHADLTDTDTDGHPGTVITIPLGVEDNAVAIAADGTLKDSGVPPGGAGGTTNLGHNRTATNVEITSSSGDNTTIAGASGTLAGFLTAADKTALDGTDAAGTPRPPTAHANTHATGQGDAIAPADIGAEPAFGKNTAFNRNFGAVADTVCQGNDSRLSDARTPTTHAATHAAGQSDELTPAAINAATSAQGALADSAVQPGDDAAVLGSGAATNGQLLTADGAGNASWQTGGGGGWQDGTTVTDWALGQQNLGTITGNVTVDLDLGHKIVGTMDGVADHEINFVSGRGHTVTDWKARIDVAGSSPIWKFNNVLITLADGYDISGASSSVGFSFELDSLGNPGVSERKYQ